MFFQNAGWNLCDSFADLTFRIIKSPEHAGPNRTGFDTGRLLIAFDAMITPRALVRVTGIGIDETHAIGTRLNAVRTADTAIRIDQFNSFRRRKSSMHRTNLIAGSVHTLVAQLGSEVRSFDKIRINGRNLRAGVTRFRNQIHLHSPVFEMHKTLNPRSCVTFRDVVFDSTCGQTLSGADAFFRIDQKSEQDFLFLHRRAQPRLCRRSIAGQSRCLLCGSTARRHWQQRQAERTKGQCCRSLQEIPAGSFRRSFMAATARSMAPTAAARWNSKPLQYPQY